MKKWRMFELKNNDLYTLFHAVLINGKKTRKLPIGEWIDAEIKEVYDGNKGKKYISGFHVFNELEYGKNFKNKFRNPRTLVLVEIEVNGNMKKKPTNSNVLLVDKIMIPLTYDKNMIIL